jgi:hypothetical protein
MPAGIGDASGLGFTPAARILHRSGIDGAARSGSTGVVSDLKQIRAAILIVIVGLVLSGVTAFPLLHEVNLLAGLLAGDSRDPAAHTGLVHWILSVREGLEVTYARYPFIAYGTDWLAFAHLTIAMFFVLPWRDPQRYVGVLKVGVWASLLVIPLAFICGPVRGIPLGWRVIDSSFGIGCVVPLVFALWKVNKLGKAGGGG